MIRSRIIQLRMQKGVSSRDMSLSLGQSHAYINKIENGKMLPSLTGLLYICEYFQITPQEFFNPNPNTPQKTDRLLTAIEKLTPEQTDHILLIIKDIISK